MYDIFFIKYERRNEYIGFFQLYLFIYLFFSFMYAAQIFLISGFKKRSWGMSCWKFDILLHLTSFQIEWHLYILHLCGSNWLYWPVDKYMVWLSKFIIPPASAKLKGGYTGFTLSVCPSVHLSVCPSVDRIVSALYLQQYLLDPFHIHTSYQATSEGVSRKFFVSKF